jgi:hypothetical protein
MHGSAGRQDRGENAETHYFGSGWILAVTRMLPGCKPSVCPQSMQPGRCIQADTPKGADMPFVMLDIERPQVELHLPLPVAAPA